MISIQQQKQKWPEEGKRLSGASKMRTFSTIRAGESSGVGLLN